MTALSDSSKRAVSALMSGSMVGRSIQTTQLIARGEAAIIAGRKKVGVQRIDRFRVMGERASDLGCTADRHRDATVEGLIDDLVPTCSHPYCQADDGVREARAAGRGGPATEESTMTADKPVSGSSAD